MGDVPHRRRLFFSSADRGRSQRGRADGVQVEPEAPQPRARISRETFHAQPLRMEERKMGEQNRTDERIPRRVLGTVQIPREGKRLGRRTVQGTLWDPSETQGFWNCLEI